MTSTVSTTDSTADSMTHSTARPEGAAPVGVARSTRSRFFLNLAFVIGPFAVLYGLARILGDRFPAWARILHDARTDPGEDSAGPIADTLERVITWFRNTEFLGLITGRDLIRALVGWIEIPLDFTKGLLIDGNSLFEDTPFGIEVPPIPWIMLVGIAAVIGSWIGGWRLALLGGGTIAYLAVFDLWEDSMVTLSTVLVTAPLSILIGWALGLRAARSRRFESVLMPFLSVTQSMPPFALFIPIVVFVSIGQVGGAVATILLAVPPMARLAMLGIRGVPSEILDAGHMSGANKRQMLWKVEMPAARPTLMVGVNQVIMQCLGMVVLASLVGMPGLGQQLLNRLQSLRIGEALEMGMAIVLMAIMLDRLSQAAARRRPEHQDEDASFLARHPNLAILGVVSLLAVGLAAVFEWALIYPSDEGRNWTISTAPFWESIVDYVQVAWRGPAQAFKDFALLKFLLPMRDFFVGIPWVALVAMVVALGWKINGARLALIAGAFAAFIPLAGFWVPAMESLYLAVAAVIVSVVIGVPAGILASRRDWSYNAMQAVLDTFQTLPSFIYLIPVVMLFQVGAVAALTAILFYAFVPAVRYTMLGMRNVPADVLEAADTSGCTGLQRLIKVKLPLALPEIMLGVNQVLMFALLMVMIAALIGGIDGLGDEVLIALRDQQAGKGLVVGLCLAALGLTADQLITSWSTERKRQLGLAGV